MHILFKKIQTTIVRDISYQMSDNICFYIKIYILYIYNWGRGRKYHQNSFDYFPELFKGQSYLWAGIITDLGKTKQNRKNQQKKHLNNTDKEIHGRRESLALGSHYPLVLHHNGPVLALKRLQDLEN